MLTHLRFTLSFLSRSVTAKSPLLHEPKLLPPEPTASNQSEDDDDEDEEEEEDDDHVKDDYVAAVCQYTTVLKETPPGFDDKKYEVNFMNLDKIGSDEAGDYCKPEHLIGKYQIHINFSLVDTNQFSSLIGC